MPRKRAFFAFSVMMVALVFGSASSQACDMEPWPGNVRPTAEQVVNHALGDKTPEFFGKVKIVKAEREEGKAIHYTMKVLRQYGGAAQEEFIANSALDNSCVFEAKEGDEPLILLNAGKEKPYDIYLYDAYFFAVPDKDIEDYLDAKAATEKK